MTLSIVAAMDRNRLIGAGNRLPWRLPADLRHFKQLTMGSPVVMGRSTWDSLARPLPGRENIVVSSALPLDTPGCTVVRSVEAGLLAASRAAEAMVIGGAMVYAQALGCADRMYLTLIDAAFEGDTYFPRFDPGVWVETAREAHDADQENPWPYSFVRLERARQGRGTDGGE